MFNFLRILLAGFVLFSANVFAVDYYWTGYNVPGTFQSSSDAITATVNGFIKGDDVSAVLLDKRGSPPTIQICVLTSTASGSTQNRCWFNIRRYGDTCPADTTEDLVTGDCVPPPHQCEVGDVIGPYKYPGVLSGGFVSPVPPAPTSACKNGCEYSRKSKSSGCQTGHFGTFCSYEYVGTGVECTASPENDMGGDSGEGPNANDGGDGGDGAGDGSDGGNNGDGGDNDHGDAQDDAPEAPESSNAEGDAKESTLQEVKSVLGTLSKESTSKKIESGISKGNTLLGEIRDAINGIPNGGGSGGDDEEESESVAVLGSCQDALECSGDAIQCAILQVQKNQLCQYQITPEVEQQIQSVFEGEENQLETKEIAIGSVFTDGLNAARWLPSTCPTPESVTVFGRSYSISWQPLCTFASALSALIVAMASIFFIVYLGKGLKGS